MKLRAGYLSKGATLRLLAPLVIVYCMCSVSVALARIDAYEGEFGSVALEGFLEVEGDIHTAQRNPNNFAQPGNPEVQLFRQWLLFDTTWQSPIPELMFYSRTRFFADNTANVDPGNIHHYDAFPYRFAGDGAAMMTVANDNVGLEGWEEWAQYQTPNSFFRLGKQTIVWGDVAPTRLLDEVNPLDVSWHVVAEPLGRDVFDHLRIPIWAARMSYTLPFLPDFQVDGYVSPDVFAYMDTQLAARNSPVNVIPTVPPFNGPAPFLRLRDNVRDGRHGASGGVRLVGLLGGVNFSLVYLTRHDPDGLLKFKSFSLVPFPPFFVVDLTQQHPRFDTAGASFNYFEQMTGTVFQGEAACDFARPYETFPNPSNHFVRRNRYGYVLALNRPTFFTSYQHKSTSLILQFEQIWREGGIGPVAIDNVTVPKHQEEITFLFEQAVEGFDWRGWNGRYDEWYLDIAVIQGLRGPQARVPGVPHAVSGKNSTAFVPLIRWEPGNHWRFATWYNLYIGPDTLPAVDANLAGFGQFTWLRGVNMAVSYLF